MKLLDNIAQQKAARRRAELRRGLLRYGARLGGSLFGPIPKGHRREFFCLDKHTWIWHEEWMDEKGQRQIVTTRYDIHPYGVLKSQGSNSYQRLSVAEARNLYRAIEQYQARFGAELHRLAQTR